MDSHPWLFSDQPMQRGTYWSRKNLFNDNIGTFCFGRYANTWNAFVYMNSVKWFCGPGEVWELENCNHQPKCLFGRDPLAGVFNFILKFKSNFFQRAFCNKTKKTPALKCLFLDFYIRRYSLTHKHSYTEVRQDGSICNIWTTNHAPHFQNVNMAELQREIFCASPYTEDMLVFHVIVKCSAMHTEIKFTFSQECPN